MTVLDLFASVYCQHFLSSQPDSEPTQKLFRIGCCITEEAKKMRDPVLAGVLSLIIPGVGQLYNGRILAGVLWLLFTPGFWIGTGGTLGWICHIVAAATAYSYAKEHPVRI